MPNDFEMTVDLNVLNHLGIRLYSSIPAIISEAVANAWDADATSVSINVAEDLITIEDDGHGMNASDINNKFLTVGYQRRKMGHAETPNGRAVFGRKGIGKLSLFSIADTIEVHSKKEGELTGLILSVPKIQETIQKGEKTYKPSRVQAKHFSTQSGTRITIRDLRKSTSHAPGPLRRRLARRFSNLSGEEASDFQVYVNGVKITREDREYFKKVEFLWLYGEHQDKLKNTSNADKVFCRDTPLSGWIGTVRSAGDLISEDGDNLNDVQIMVRGRVAQEKTLQFYGEDGVYASYIVGEIHADELDDDDKEDIATSNRQSLFEDDERVKNLHALIKGELKIIQKSWTNLRNSSGTKAALEVPEVNDWFKTLGSDQKSKASQLFGKINQLKLEAIEKKPLFKYGLLAFEKLKLRDSLGKLDNIQADDFSGFLQAFEDHDDLEAQLYYEISRGRLDIIEKFQGLTEDNHLEKVLQKFLFEHLWLLDPAWDRGTSEPVMEAEVKKAVLEGKEFDGEYMKKIGRVDIQYRKSGGEHLIIELKRANRVTSTIELLAQVQKYQTKMDQLLTGTNRSHEAYEIICLVGKDLTDWKNPKGREISRQILKVANTRIVTYQELIGNARRAYNAYLKASKEASKIFSILEAIDKSL